MINRVQFKLSQKKIEANIGDRQNHVIKIVTGVGRHSLNNQAVLRHKIP